LIVEIYQVTTIPETKRAQHNTLTTVIESNNPVKVVIVT